MIMKLKQKLIAAAVMLLTGVAAQATPFYLDIGTNYDPTGLNKVCPTCTSVKDEFNIRYESRTTIGPGGTTSTIAGTTFAGFSSSAISKNLFTQLTPTQIMDEFSDNGFKDNYYITFGITGLTGQVVGTYGPGGLPAINYNAGGVIDLYLWFNSTTYVNFMDIVITGGASDGNGTGINGYVDFTNVTNLTYANLFHAVGPSCSGFGNGYYDIWKNCSGPTDPMVITLNSHFDTTTAFVSGNQVSGIHDGSGTFDIPEPGSMALVGLGLIGAGMARRRKAA
jgi:hypothetical protein